LNSAVRRNRGKLAYKTRAAIAAKGRATPLGKAPSAFKIAHTAAYSSHSFIRLRYCDASKQVSYALTFTRTNVRLSLS
jgi:hypothetical protein